MSLPVILLVVLIALIVSVVLAVPILFLMYVSQRNLAFLIQRNTEAFREEIRFSTQPMVEIPIGIEEITDLANEVWKMEQRLSKASESLPENHKRGLDSSLQKLKRYLEKYDIEIQDYSGQKYNEGLNLEILSVETKAGLAFPMVKEVIEPTIICRGRVVKKAKIILETPE